MGSMVRFKTAPVVVGLVVALLLTMALPPGLAAADNDEDGNDENGTEEPRDLGPPIPDGEWLGGLDAFGSHSGTFPDGITADVDTVLSGSFAFDVVDGSAAGDWSFFAYQTMDFDTPGGPGSALILGSGGGPLSGGGRALQLTGESTTTGTVVGQGAAQSIGPNVHPIETMDVQVLSVGCNTVVGDWATGLNNVVDSRGLTGSLDGTFVATHWGERPVDPRLPERIDAIFDEARELFDEGREAGYVDVAPAYDIVHRAVALEQEARDHEGCVFGDDLEFYASAVTRILASLLGKILTERILSVDELADIVDLLLYVGAVGAGAHPQFAEVLEPAIADQVVRIINDNLSTDPSKSTPSGRSCSAASPCVLGSSDVIAALTVAARLDLSLTTLGGTVSAAEALERAL